MALVERSGASDGAHSGGLTEISALGTRTEDWLGFLAEGLDDPALQAMRRVEHTGRPLGDADFIARLEAATGRQLAPRKRGPKPRSQRDGRDNASLV
jgi:putative transposase